MVEKKQIHQFESGATRSVETDRPCYRKALSPIVLQYYVAYINKHRKQADGSMRDWDNWKSGIPKDRSLEGLGRHDMSVWLLMQGFPAYDNNGPVTLKDSLCGIIFNSTSLLHEILKEEMEQKKAEGSDDSISGP